ncbi:MAG: hypothetical protein RQ752_04925 [Thermohalobaculum sp.]|nr:hypothetical protein [Thermohalobaculum sp.]
MLHHPALSLASPVADRHEVAALWRLWGPLAVALAVAVLHHTVPGWTWRRLFAEGWGAIELAHFFIPLAASVVALRSALRLPRDASPALRIWLGALALGCFYIAGEEHSWGQHFFGWETPEDWAAINRQDETNLHNSTSWLNHKPRVLLNVGVLIGSVLVPLAMAWGKAGGLIGRVRFVLPGASCHVLGWLVLFYMAWDSGRKAGFLPYISPRDAEMHELFLYGYLLVYAITLRNRIGRWPKAA